jgi:hypothetical protein
MNLSRNIERHKLHLPSAHRLHSTPGQTNERFSKLMFKHFKLQLDLEEQNKMNSLLWTNYLATLFRYSYTSFNAILVNTGWEWRTLPIDTVRGS